MDESNCKNHALSMAELMATDFVKVRSWETSSIVVQVMNLPSIKPFNEYVQCKLIVSFYTV